MARRKEFCTLRAWGKGLKAWIGKRRLCRLIRRGENASCEINGAARERREILHPLSRVQDDGNYKIRIKFKSKVRNEFKSWRSEDRRYENKNKVKKRPPKKQAAATNSKENSNAKSRRDAGATLARPWRELRL